jgi:hypothetical protein
VAGFSNSTRHAFDAWRVEPFQAERFGCARVRPNTMRRPGLFFVHSREVRCINRCIGQERFEWNNQRAWARSDRMK